MRIYASQYEDDNFNLIINGVADIHMCYLEGEKMAEQINGEVNIPANDFKDCYVPSNNMAISASASNIEMAKEYIKVALGEDCQSENCFGFSVNKDALKSYNWYFHNIWVDQEGATDTDAEKDHFDELIEDVIKSLENVNRPIVKDYVIDDLVIDALQDYICEDADKDAVLDNVMSKLKLYMAE